MQKKIYSPAIDSPWSSFDAASYELNAAISKGTTHLKTALSIYAFLEFLAIIGSAYFAVYLYHFLVLKSWTWQKSLAYTPAAIGIATLVLLISLGFHNFSAIRRQGRHKFQWRGVGAVALAFSIFLTMLFLTQLGDNYSRGTLIFQFIGACITVARTRSLFYSWLHNAIASGQIEARRVALIGNSADCSIFSSRLKSSGIRSVGAFPLPKCRDISRDNIVASATRELIAEIRYLRPDDIIILARDALLPKMLNLTSALAELPAGVHLVPIDAPNVLVSAQIVNFGNLHTIELHRRPLSAFDLLVKRASDLVIATVGLLLLLPLFLIISIAIKLDSSGPIFFCQKRHGFNNEEINVFKFRSMISGQDEGQFTQATEDDPRVTRVGRIIRRTNIDELPQLFNVMRGDMSIVGPRPHATAHNSLFNHLIAKFSSRHNVKPGITGWAQINGYRGATDTLEKMQRRIEYDLEYINNWSFLFDIKIIAMTVYSKQAYTNAY